jgi:hypothetical protein
MGGKSRQELEGIQKIESAVATSEKTATSSLSEYLSNPIFVDLDYT